MSVHFKVLTTGAAFLFPLLALAQYQAVPKAPAPARPARPFRSLAEQPLPPTTPVQLAGSVVTDTGEPLPGATVLVKGTYLASPTNSGGQYLLTLPGYQVWPVVLSTSFVGYQTRYDTLALPPAGPLRVVLRPAVTQVNEVVVSASRREERGLSAPVTVERLSAEAIARLGQPDLLTNLGRQKGVDVTTSGLFMASLSTRGFQGANSERLVQLVDFADTQSPSLNINAGNSLGLPEVDIASVEILHGPSSALYGANAFNGVVLTTSRDPFLDPGLSVRLRGGSRDYADGQLRYAQKLGRRFAFKLVGSYARGLDWVASNYGAQSQLDAPGNNAAGSSLGYDAVNRYGDLGNTFGASGGALSGKTVYMPGWSEQELIAGDNHASLYRVIPSLHFLVSDKVQAMVQFKRAEGTTAYQAADRYRLKNFATNQWRAELKGEKWFLRAFSTQDFGANTYDLLFTGTFMNTAVDPRSGAAGLTYAQEYFGTYARVYNTYLAQNPGDAEGAGRAAQQAAAPYQLQAGSDAFNALRQRIVTDNTSGRGARINPSSFLNEVSGQREWMLDRARQGRLNLVVGGAYRQYRLGSDGQFFGDFDGRRILNYEYGGYAQVTGRLLGDHLKLTGAARLDDSQNFHPVFSPRASAVYSLGADQRHNFRLSYNQAYRSPVQQGQYLYLDLARVLLLANIQNGYQGYRLPVTAALGTILRNPATAQAALDAYAVTVERLRPERVQTWEVGYKGEVLPGLVLDVNAYTSWYRDFIGQFRFLANTDGSKPTVAQVATAATLPQPFQSGPTRVIQVQANATQEVHVSGGLVSLSYSPLKALTLAGNYTLSVLHRDNLPEGFQTFYNTPRHKYNVGAYGLLARGRLGYSLNYRWAEGFLWESSFGTGQLASQQALDAQLSYALARTPLTFQAGGSNLFDSGNIQVYGGPQVGRLVYAGVQLDLK